MTDLDTTNKEHGKHVAVPVREPSVARALQAATALHGELEQLRLAAESQGVVAFASLMRAFQVNVKRIVEILAAVTP